MSTEDEVKARALAVLNAHRWQWFTNGGGFQCGPADGLVDMPEHEVVGTTVEQHHVDVLAAEGLLAAASPAPLPAAAELVIMDVAVLPTGATLDDWEDVSSWALHVRWRGPRTESGRGGWAVTSLFVEHQLSRAGKWSRHVQPFQQRLYRWETFEEALAAARAAVDSYVTGGHTWAQFLTWRREQQLAAQADTDGSAG